MKWLHQAFCPETPIYFLNFNTAQLLLCTVLLSQSHFVCPLSMHFYICIDLIFHIYRDDRPHDLPYHDCSCFFWLSTTEWDYCSIYRDWVCTHPTPIFHAWSSWGVWYVVGLPLHVLIQTTTCPGIMLGMFCIIFISISLFKSFQHRLLWTTTMSHTSVNFRMCIAFIQSH